ncbi:MAG: GerW family sporulation protein [Clostridia bacterium]|nr:GerW family sporulation protein [Clostridia bacterium]
MDKNQIEGLMDNTMKNIKDMIDVNTIIGTPIQCFDNTIIPISKVNFGFASGGSEFNTCKSIKEYKKADREEELKCRNPFGGGSGAGISISPIAFLIVKKDNIKLLHVSPETSLDKLLDYVPDIIEKGNKMLKKTDCSKNP